MLRRSSVFFGKKIFGSLPEKNYVSSETDFNYIEETWGMDLIDLKDYGQKILKLLGITQKLLINLATLAEQFD